MFHIAGVRIDEKKLIGLALRVLEEAFARSQDAPVARSFAIRLALAYLASTRDCERWPFDGFWRWIISADNKSRAANLTCNLNGIYRQLGVRRP